MRVFTARAALSVGVWTIVGAFLFVVLTRTAYSASASVAYVDVDAREASRGIERAHLSLSVHPGYLKLLYPKWLPGDHSPSGPIASLGGLKFVAGGRVLPWRRDPLDMYAIELEIPAHVSTLEVDLEVTAADAPSGLSAMQVATGAVAIILWNRLLLYPAGVSSDQLQYRPSLTVPAGWQLASALTARETNGNHIVFAPETLTTLIDSTVLTAKHLRTVELGGSPAVFLHLAADSDAALEMPAEMIAHYKALVAEASALFGGAHYRAYHFLWTLSNHIARDGIEHHESSDDRSPEKAVIDDEVRRSEATLLPHEYAHSWNGKYRRPIGLAPRDFNTPYDTRLLWVYEGLTEYLQEILAVRAGLLTPREYQEDWAVHAAEMETRRGRQWRSLQDVATSAQFEYDQSKEWTARTRDTDFYGESALLWLEADVLIRTLSQGRRSLDDFCRAFLGGVTSKPQVKVYQENDVFAALAAVQPYDWKSFWQDRLQRLRPHAPLEGLEASGWHLAYSAVASSMQRSYDTNNHRTDLRYSLGFLVADEGAILTDIIPGSPADVAGVAPGSALIALDGRKWSRDTLQQALRGPRSTGVLTLLLEKDELLRQYEVTYSGTERYPILQRDASRPDLLSDIARPRTTHANAP
jgi:predicted metalloprotease with PDZ domain